MLSSIIKIISIILLIFVVLTAWQYIKICHYSSKVKLTIQPFQKINPQSKYKVLFAGDSTAVGTGASNNLFSTAGWFSQDYPAAHIENYSVNGLRLRGLIKILSGLQDKHYDLAILQIGANDILYFSSLKTIKKQERHILELAKNIAKKVIILHSGDIGKAPLFHWPFTWIYHQRSMGVRDIYIKSQDERVSYVDIYKLWDQLPEDRSVYYAQDKLHLSDEGYHLWYDFIRSELSEEKED